MSISSICILIGYMLTIFGFLDRWVNIASLVFWILLMLAMLVKKLQVMKNWRIRLYLKWSDFMCCVTYPYYMFLMWRMVITNDSYLENIGESRQYFWDSLSFNQGF